MIRKFIFSTKAILCLLTIINFYACKKSSTSANQHKKMILSESLKNANQHRKIALSENLGKLKNPQNNKIFVIAHRGDWRNAPENSIQAIKNCIDMRVDVVEIDVQKTKDNKLVIMHDKTIDRTTTGKGKVSEWILKDLKTLYLKNGMGIPTHHRIPTLKEALLEAKGKILLNLDKCYRYFDQAYAIMKETGTTKQTIMKAYDKTYEQIRKNIGKKLDSVAFMPIMNLNTRKNAWNIIARYQEEIHPVAFEMVFSKDTSKVISKFKDIRKKGSRVWVNSLWANLNAEHEDDKALINPDSIYGWYINKGINMIQTDRPQLLLNYLRKQGLHE